MGLIYDVNVRIKRLFHNVFGKKNIALVLKDIRSAIESLPRLLKPLIYL